MDFRTYLGGNKMYITNNQDRFRFRVWNENLKAYQYFKFNYLEGSSLPSSQWYIDKKPIEQCVGLRDRKDNCIYENDIIENLNSGNKFRVIFINQGFKLKSLNEEILFDFYVFEQKWLEVIGSIREVEIYKLMEK